MGKKSLFFVNLKNTNIMKKQKVSKQIVGIDISKDSFYACYKIRYENERVVIKGITSFENTFDGFILFLNWCEKRNKTPEIKPIYVMEATGVYYEDLAYFLNSKEKIVSVQLAQKIKYYAKSCNLKTKTDKVDCKMIAEFGIEKNLKGTDLWTPPSKEFKIIRDLSRERSSLKRSQTSAELQLHAMNHSHEKTKSVIAMKEEQIVFYQTQVKKVEKEIENLVKKDKGLYAKIEKIQTIKGVGFITIITVLTEVNGFLLFKNIRQLVSYAGLDVVDKESGKYVGKTKISKKGNVHLRTALYMPAISAIRYNEDLKSFNNRVMKNRKIKKQGIVAVMRKILILIYTLWNKDEKYIENYQAVKICSNNQK